MNNILKTTVMVLSLFIMSFFASYADSDFEIRVNDQIVPSIDNVHVGDKIRIINLKPEETDIRFQLKKQNLDWAPYGEFLDELNYEIIDFEQIGFHVDQKNNTSGNIIGTWIGTAIVQAPDKGKKTIEINKRDIEVVSDITHNKLNTFFSNEDKVTIDLKKRDPNWMLSLYVKVKDGDWILYRDFDPSSIKYTFPDVEYIDLQVNIQSKENLSDSFQIWLGTFYNVDVTNIESVKPINELLLNERAQNITGQMLGILFIYAIGLLLVLPLMKILDKWLLYSLAFIIGTIVFALTSIAVLFLSIPYNLVTIAIAIGIVIVIIYKFIYRLKINLRDFKFDYIDLIFNGAMIGIVYLLVNNNGALLSFDSVYYVYFGKSLGVYGTITENLEQTIKSYGLYMPFFHTVASFFNYDFSYAFNPLVSIMYAIFMGRGTFLTIKKRCYSFVFTLFISLMAVIMLCSSYFFIFHSFWIMNNLLAGIIGSIMMIALYMSSETKDTNEKNIWFIITVLFYLCFFFSRVEAPLFGAIYLLILLGWKRVNITTKLTITNAIMTALWYLVLFAKTGFKGDLDFLTINKAIMIIAFSMVVPLVSLIKEKGLLKIIFKHYNGLLVVGVTFVVSLLAIAKPNHFKESLDAFTENIMSLGYWNNYWVMAFILLIISFIYSFVYKNKAQEFLYFIYINFALIWIMMLIRVYPMRLGFGDSGNRMLFNIYPLLPYVIMIAITKRNEVQHENTNDYT